MTDILVALALMLGAVAIEEFVRFCNRDHPDLKPSKPKQRSKLDRPERTTVTNLARSGYVFVDQDDIQDYSQEEIPF